MLGPLKNFTHGEILRWRRVGGLLLAEVEYEAGRRIHRHVHPHASCSCSGDRWPKRAAARRPIPTDHRRCCSGARTSHIHTTWLRPAELAGVGAMRWRKSPCEGPLC